MNNIGASVCVCAILASGGEQIVAVAAGNNLVRSNVNAVVSLFLLVIGVEQYNPIGCSAHRRAHIVTVTIGP